MKIIIINGSPRKHGATATMLGTISEQLKKNKDIEIECINISDMDMGFCKGCSKCFETGECFLKDDAEILSQKIAVCDGLIIGSPTYESNISGQLKTFLDRGHFIMEQLLRGKIAMSVVVGENYGMRDSSRVLTNLFRFSGAQISSKVTEKIPFANKYILSEKLKTRLIKKADKFYMDFKRGKVFSLDKLSNYFIFNFGIKPFIISKGTLGVGVQKHWKENANPKNTTQLD